MSGALEQIVALSRALGDPALDLAILGEGNTSLRTGDGTMLVKASGASLASVSEADAPRVDARCGVSAVFDAGHGASLGVGSVPSCSLGYRKGPD